MYIYIYLFVLSTPILITFLFSFFRFFSLFGSFSLFPLFMQGVVLSIKYRVFAAILPVCFIHFSVYLRLLLYILRLPFDLRFFFVRSLTCFFLSFPHAPFLQCEPIIHTAA
uniref:Uncharacterized protein n=1 Tax=Trypanosoma congolense (strain IL3000) TaxID=1068625 RepID=G0UZP7_TRYCI|nr:hypothetical protein, unlikely [Trypanosoma congolense IL3000]